MPSPTVSGLPERILVVTEKPSSAKRIAEALADNGSEVGRVGEVTYYIARKGNNELIVVPALGHLYSIVQAGGGWTYPVYEMRWVPVHQAVKGHSRARAHIEAFTRLGRGASSYVSACDYDNEGSLIAYNVLKYAVGDNALSRSSRMLYSTLTKDDLNRSWENRLDTLDYTVIAAGKARHETDWLYGINLSRALTLAVRRASGSHRTLSIGRVQGPTLGFVKQREDEINRFVPVPYWRVQAETVIGGEVYPMEYEKPRLERESHAKELASACRDGEGIVKEVKEETERRLPPPPFNLGDLQREAYRVHRMSPASTLAAAEKLYLGAYISYPRTSSQRLPPSIDLRDILGKLKGNPDYAPHAEELLRKKALRPRQGRKDDPAHPAIHPTGARPRRLGDQERKVYDLVVRRFLACLGAPALVDKVGVEVDVNGYLFYLRGSVTRRRGWLEYYPYMKDRDRPLPALSTGMAVPVTRLQTKRCYTKPPPRFNASSLLQRMEQENIGTKATRTAIIDTLSKRGYIIGSSVRITDLGYGIVETLEVYCPGIMSVEMTRGLEEKLERIQTGGEDAEQVVGGAKADLGPILARFKANETPIGEAISETLNETTREENYLGPCPTCGKGDVLLNRNSGTEVVYASCSNPDCKQSYGLPQKKRIHPTGKSCPACGAPMVKMYFNRKPWTLCINAACPTKGEAKDD